MKEKKSTGGRPKTPDNLKKQPHSLSFNVSEWADLTKRAKKAGVDRSAYVIRELKLK